MNEPTTIYETFLKAMEPMPPEARERIAQLPPDVQKVVGEFLVDIELAQTNLKTCIVDGFYWLNYARDQLCVLLSYLKTEQLREEWGIGNNADKSRGVEQ
jgi:hypothetical protein